MGDKHVVNTAMHTTFEVEVGANLVEFRLGKEKGGGDAMARIDGGKWIPARVVHLAMASFDERFPMAFLDQDEGR